MISGTQHCGARPSTLDGVFEIELTKGIRPMANDERPLIRVPDVLFQYCRERSINIFEENRIKSSTPSTLNDPFEWKPVVAEQATADQIRKTLTTTHNRAPLPEPPTRVTVAKMKSNVPEAAKRYQDQFRIDLEKKTRIICFSQRNDGILMWAHYADQHKVLWSDSSPKFYGAINLTRDFTK